MGCVTEGVAGVEGGGGRMGGSDNKGDGLASQPRRYWVPGQPLLNRHQVGGVSRSGRGKGRDKGRGWSSDSGKSWGRSWGCDFSFE